MRIALTKKAGKQVKMNMPFDFKKEYKGCYMPKKKPEIITVPPMNYIAVSGEGDTNEEGGAYKQAIGVLYAVAYTLKMSYKTDYRIDGFLRQYRISIACQLRRQIFAKTRSKAQEYFLYFEHLRQRIGE